MCSNRVLCHPQYSFRDCGDAWEQLHDQETETPICPAPRRVCPRSHQHKGISEEECGQIPYLLQESGKFFSKPVLRAFHVCSYRIKEPNIPHSWPDTMFGRITAEIWRWPIRQSGIPTSGCRTSNLGNSMTTIFPMPYGRISPFPSVLRSISTISIRWMRYPPSPRLRLPQWQVRPANLYSVSYVFAENTSISCLCVRCAEIMRFYKNAPISYDLNLGDDVWWDMSSGDACSGCFVQPDSPFGFWKTFCAVLIMYLFVSFVVVKLPK